MFPKKLLQKMLNSAGYSIIRHEPNLEYEIKAKIPEINEYDLNTILIAKEISMQSVERIYSLINSVKYICANGVRGDFV